MGSKTEKDKMDGKSFPILEDLGEEEDANIKVRRASCRHFCDGGGGDGGVVIRNNNAYTCNRVRHLYL